MAEALRLMVMVAISMRTALKIGLIDDSCDGTEGLSTVEAPWPPCETTFAGPSAAQVSMSSSKALDQRDQSVAIDESTLESSGCCASASQIRASGRNKPVDAC
jgi:hypothetical protein